MNFNGHDLKDSRSANLNINIGLMFVCKGISVLISFLYVPILIHEFNSVNYGIWITLTSLIGWLNIMDIGLGNGLRNMLGLALARGDTSETKKLVGTAYAALTVWALIILPVIIWIFNNLNWPEILNAPAEMSNELRMLALITVTCFLSNFVLNLINSVLYALQKPALSSFIGVISQLCAFIIVYILSCQEEKYSLLLYGTVVAVIPVLTTAVCTVYLFGTVLKELRFGFKDIQLSYCSKLCSLGIKFFLIQATGLVLFGTNNFILTQSIGPSSVTDYNVSYKLIGSITMVFTIIVTPLWSAVTDAYGRGDYNWIRQTYKKMTRIWLCLCIAGLCLVICSSPIYEIWLDGELCVDYKLQVLMLAYCIVNMWTAFNCNIINGIGKVSLQFYITLFEAVIYIPLAIMLAHYLGIYGVVLAIFIVTLINSIWEPIQIKKIISGNASGIWSK